MSIKFRAFGKAFGAPLDQLCLLIGGASRMPTTLVNGHFHKEKRQRRSSTGISARKNANDARQRAFPQGKTPTTLVDGAFPQGKTRTMLVDGAFPQGKTRTTLVDGAFPQGKMRTTLVDEHFYVMVNDSLLMMKRRHMAYFWFAGNSGRRGPHTNHYRAEKNPEADRSWIRPRMDGTAGKRRA